MNNKSCLLVPALAFVVAVTGQSLGATVHSGDLTTSYETEGGGTAVVDVSASLVVNLGDLAALTPGQPIRIEFTPDAELLWVGGFYADAGNLTLLWKATVGIMAGTHSLSYADEWSIGPVAFEGGSPVGYSTGPVPVTRSLVVPWGTDLTAVALTLTDQSAIVGTNAVFVQSSIALSGATFTTSSVPECGGAVLVALGLLWIPWRRSR